MGLNRTSRQRLQVQHTPRERVRGKESRGGQTLLPMGEGKEECTRIVPVKRGSH